MYKANYKTPDASSNNKLFSLLFSMACLTLSMVICMVVGLWIHNKTSYIKSEQEEMNMTAFNKSLNHSYEKSIHDAPRAGYSNK